VRLKCSLEFFECWTEYSGSCAANEVKLLWCPPAIFSFMAAVWTKVDGYITVNDWRLEGSDTSGTFPANESILVGRYL
jgi:hypothetical protein